MATSPRTEERWVATEDCAFRQICRVQQYVKCTCIYNSSAVLYFTHHSVVTRADLLLHSVSVPYLAAACEQGHCCALQITTECCGCLPTRQKRRRVALGAVHVLGSFRSSSTVLYCTTVRTVCTWSCPLLTTSGAATGDASAIAQAH